MESGRIVRRRQLLKGGLAAGAAAAAAAAAPGAQAHVERPGGWKADLLQSLLGRPAKRKVVFANANVEAPQLPQAKNWLNALQFSYGNDPDDLLLVFALYASANILNYNDVVWSRYSLGEKYGIKDPTTGDWAKRNIYQPRTGADEGALSPDDPNSFYQESNIYALQKRGALFLA